MATASRWTSEEDALLADQVTEQQRTLGSESSINWNDIARVLPGRNNKDCRKRWINVMKGRVDGTVKKGPWQPQEDELLLRAIEKRGPSWVRIAESVPGRTPDQCSKRWQHSLDPSLDRSYWSEKDNQKLLEVVDSMGRKWVEIRNRHFPRRSANSVKNQYTILTRKTHKSASKRGSRSGSGDYEADSNDRRGRSESISDASLDDQSPSAESWAASSTAGPQTSSKTHSTVDMHSPTDISCLDPAFMMMDERPLVATSSSSSLAPSMVPVNGAPSAGDIHMSNTPGHDCFDPLMAGFDMADGPDAHMPGFLPNMDLMDFTSDYLKLSGPGSMSAAGSYASSSHDPEASAAVTAATNNMLDMADLMELPAQVTSQPHEDTVQIQVKGVAPEVVKQLLNVLMSTEGNISFEVKRNNSDTQISVAHRDAQ